MSLCSKSHLLQTEVSLRKVESSTKWLLALLWTMLGSIPAAGEGFCNGSPLSPLHQQGVILLWPKNSTSQVKSLA